jgi:hypothetical protein
VTSLRRVVRWVFLVGPCRLYLAGEASGGSVPWSFLGGLLGAGALSGGVGSVVALIRGAAVGDAFWWWAIGGVLALTVWAAYSLLVIVVLWVLGRAPQTIRGVVDSTPSADRGDQP